MDICRILASVREEHRGSACSSARRHSFPPDGFHRSEGPTAPSYQGAANAPTGNVAAGDYNTKIDHRIARIKSTSGIQ
jgi:hypothetical protein